MDTLTYEHVSFNVPFNAAKSVGDFVEHEKHVGLSDEQLKEAHALIVEANKPKAPEPVVVEEPKEKTEAGSIPLQAPTPKPTSVVLGDDEIHLLNSEPA